MAKNLTCPIDFFGHEMGADRKIARWDKIVEYFFKLESESNKIKVVNMGPSTEGNPFLAVYITAENNLKNLKHYRNISEKIANPNTIVNENINDLIKEGKAVIVQSMSLHASEIGGTQMAPLLAYELLTKTDEETNSILENVIFIMVPCFNPDGQLMVTDWYNDWLDTEYEGCSMPWLYHKYAGHDNNRDAFALNLIESQYMAQLLFKQWFPQAFQDHHHMGSYGARFYVAPYCDPIRPYADPLIWRELAWYGSHMAYKLEEEGIAGVLSGGQFPGWGHFGYHWLTNHHNIAGMLTESASANLASPKYIEPTLLTGSNSKSFPEYQAQSNFPNPWKGGWWHLSDIVNQQKISAWALLDMAARNKETILKNTYIKAVNQTERGSLDEEYAYLIPAKQHDSKVVKKLIQLLLNQGIEVKTNTADLTVASAVYPEGSYIVFLAQPKMGVIKSLLSKTSYPDNFYTENLNGESMAFDTATDTIAEYMGVTVIPLGNEFEGQFAVVDFVPNTNIIVEEGNCYVFDNRINNSFKALNLLQNKGLKVYRINSSVYVNKELWPAGSFYVECNHSIACEVANLADVSFIKANDIQLQDYHKTELKELKIGLFQRYWGGNTDEGWTRLVLEKYNFKYITIKDNDLPSLNEKIDVLIIPCDEEDVVIDVTKAKSKETKMLLKWFGDTIPPQYRSGIGDHGLQALKDFVQNGGRLVTLDESCNIAIKAFDLKINNIVKEKSSKEYMTHGSTLWVDVNNNHSLAYGMPKKALVFNWDSPIFQVDDRFSAQNYEVYMRYVEKNILQSGQLNGEKLLSGQAAAIKTHHGKGDIILLSVPVHFRAQLEGTFKLLFNTLL